MTFNINLRWLFAVTVLFSATPCEAQYFFQGKKPYVTQLHIHGWSNHNGSPKPGSLQYHNWQSDSVGVDVIWWSEHDPIYTQDTMLLSLDSAIINPVSLDIENLQYNDNGQPNKWECISKQGNPVAVMNSDTLNMGLTATGAATTFEVFSYSPRSISGLIKSFGFPKPLACRPLMQFRMDPVINNPVNTGLELIFRLAWHYRQQDGQDIVVFEFVPDTVQASMNTNNIDSVWVKVPVSAGWQLINLDILNAALLLDHGIDNTISDMELRLKAMQGANIASAFCDFTLVPLYTEPDSIVVAEKAVVDDYSTSYHTHNILGVEYSGDQHLNGYFPKSVSNHQIFDANVYPTVTDWVDAIHLNGGLVSFNHMFGTNWLIDTIPLQEYRSDTIAANLLGNDAYGSDILEVGYYKRGGADFEHHLETWDKLTANGLFLYGNGVSDTHGGIWIGVNKMFHTYIWATDSSDTDLLSSLSLGKMYFGNHKFFQGELYYALGNLEMGDRGFINQNNVQPYLHITQLPAGSQIRLTQVLLDTTLQLNYLHNETLIDTTAMPLLDMTVPSFVRFGVYDASGSPLVFGQPVVILGLQTGVETSDDDSGNGIKIYPNPTTEKLNMEFIINVPGKYTVKIYNLQSHLIETIDNRYFYKGKHGYSVKVDHLKAGVYILEIAGSQPTRTNRFVIE